MLNRKLPRNVSFIWFQIESPQTFISLLYFLRVRHMFIWFHHRLSLRERGITPDTTYYSMLLYFISLSLSLSLLFSHYNLFFGFVSAFGDVKVSQLVHVSVLVRGNHSQPISHVMLLQILLRQIFQVSLRHSGL
jgi:hypothetical protein